MRDERGDRLKDVPVTEYREDIRQRVELLGGASLLGVGRGILGVGEDND